MLFLCREAFRSGEVLRLPSSSLNPERSRECREALLEADALRRFNRSLRTAATITESGFGDMALSLAGQIDESESVIVAAVLTLLRYQNLRPKTHSLFFWLKNLQPATARGHSTAKAFRSEPTAAFPTIRRRAFVQAV